LANKNSLKVSYRLTDEVVAQAASPTSYIDDVFYQQKMDE
jgi:hypothetical protein